MLIFMFRFLFFVYVCTGWSQGGQQLGIPYYLQWCILQVCAGSYAMHMCVHCCRPPCIAAGHSALLQATLHCCRQPTCCRLACSNAWHHLGMAWQPTMHGSPCPPTHPFTQPSTHPPTHPPNHPPTHPPTHAMHHRAWPHHAMPGIAHQHAMLAMVVPCQARHGMAWHGMAWHGMASAMAWHACHGLAWHHHTMPGMPCSTMLCHGMAWQPTLHGSPWAAMHGLLLNVSYLCVCYAFVCYCVYVMC